MSEQILQQRRFIRSLKIRKQHRIQRVICSGCGGEGHQNSRSWSCPRNAHYGQVTRAQRAQQERDSRRAGAQAFSSITRNIEARRCIHCVNDTCPPHSTSKSQHCHNHNPTMSDVMRNVLGQNYQTKVRKCTLKRALIIRNSIKRKKRLRAKKRILKEVNRVVDWVREVAIKTQCFIQFYVLRKLSEDEDLLPGFFKSQSVYGMMQLVMGNPITNINDPTIPTDRQEMFRVYSELFNSPDDCKVRFIHGYAHCLSYLSETIATANLNAIVETFRLRTEIYLAFKLRQALNHESWPSKALMKKICSFMYTTLSGIEADPEPEIDSDAVRVAMDNILENRELLGLQPTNIGNLKASPHVYAKILWGFLSEMELAQIQRGGRQIVDTCDIAWLKITLNEYDAFKVLPRRKRQLILRSTLKLINDPSIDININYQIAPTLTDQLRNIIVATRTQLTSSRLYLAGLAMDPSLCFSTETASFTLTPKLFSLLPVFGLTKKFVNFDARTWKYLLKVCKISTPNGATGATGLERINDDFDIFDQSLDMRKVRLQHSQFNLNRYNTEHPPEDVDYVFNNLIRTDGHTVEFLFNVKKSNNDVLPDLVMSDLGDMSDIPEEEQKTFADFEVYGVDPGHRHLVTGVNVRGIKKRFSNNEWYHKSGVIKRRYKNNKKKIDENIHLLESHLHSKKTSVPECWIMYCQSLFDSLGALSLFYGPSFTNDRFLNYVGKQKMQNEVVNIFTSGGKKYVTHVGINKLPLLVVGGGGVNSVAGKKTSMATKALSSLKRAEAEGKLIICYINEHFTSKVCCLCLQQTNTLKTVRSVFDGSEISLWGVLVCEICEHNWERDYNASINILNLGIREYNGEERPAVFITRMDE